jgi:circadian clock protein KaiB
MKSAPYFKFRLYVAGDAHNSALAIANLSALCRQHIAARHEIEIVDVLREPNRAMQEGVLLTPMLVRYSPSPVRRVIGNLSEQAALLSILELPP